MHVIYLIGYACYYKFKYTYTLFKPIKNMLEFSHIKKLYQILLSM